MRDVRAHTHVAKGQMDITQEHWSAATASDGAACEDDGKMS